MRITEAIESCDNCGVCCMGENLLPNEGATRGLLRVPVHLQAELRVILAGPLCGDDGCPCVWLDRATGKCKHYNFRPDICRDYERGGYACVSARRQSGIA